MPPRRSQARELGCDGRGLAARAAGGTGEKVAAPVIEWLVRELAPKPLTTRDFAREASGRRSFSLVRVGFFVTVAHRKKPLVFDELKDPSLPRRSQLRPSGDELVEVLIAFAWPADAKVVVDQLVQGAPPPYSSWPLLGLDEECRVPDPSDPSG